MLLNKQSCKQVSDIIIRKSVANPMEETDQDGPKRKNVPKTRQDAPKAHPGRPKTERKQKRWFQDGSKMDPKAKMLVFPLF